MITVIAITFSVFLLLGIPISFTMGLCSLVFLLIIGNVPLRVIGTQMFTGVDSFPYMAIPFFILAGELMSAGGITTRLIKFATALVGRIRAGLAHTLVIAEMILSGVTGSAVADAAALATVLLPAMEKEGYDKTFTIALISAASVLGPIIPPSIIMVIYGVTASESIGALFLTGFIPGALMAICLMITTRLMGKWYPLPLRAQGTSLKEIVGGSRDAVLSLIMPVIVIGGILGGIFTPTEAAAVAVVYAFIVGFFVFKELKLSMLPRIFVSSGATSSMVCLIASCASIFSLLLATEQIPQKLSASVISFTTNPIIVLALLNFFLLIAGCLADTASLILILTPILLPLAMQAGVHPLHFGIIMTLNLSIGLITPPVGVCLFVGCAVGGVTIEKLTRTIWPYVLSHLVVLGIITYFPGLALWLPRLFGYAK